MRSVSQLPIVAQLTFDEDGQTLAGVTARDAVERLRTSGVTAIGANCGLGPQAALTALGEMAELVGENGLLLSAQPNVGLPSRSGGRLVYPNATPDYFAEFAAQARRSARASSAVAAGRRRPRSRRFARPSRKGASRGSGFSVVERDIIAPFVRTLAETELQRKLEARDGSSRSSSTRRRGRTPRTCSGSRRS